MHTAPFRDATEHYIGKIEAAAYVTVTLRHIKDGNYWHAYANSEDVGGRTVASATGDGPFTCLDRLVGQLGVSFADDAVKAVAA